MVQICLTFANENRLSIWNRKCEKLAILRYSTGDVSNPIEIKRDGVRQERDKLGKSGIRKMQLSMYCEYTYTKMECCNTGKFSLILYRFGGMAEW